MAKRKPKQVFVFGSNEAGIHGAGAAQFALENCGAELYQGVGMAGDSYAIPTKDTNIKTLPLKQIRKYVDQFLRYTAENPKVDFFVTRIGCGLAGYTDIDIAPMFDGAPRNCILPKGWWALANNYVEHNEQYPFEY
jgi:hypothetical protein